MVKCITFVESKGKVIKIIEFVQDESTLPKQGQNFTVENTRAKAYNVQEGAIKNERVILIKAHLLVSRVEPQNNLIEPSQVPN